MELWETSDAVLSKEIRSARVAVHLQLAEALTGRAADHALFDERVAPRYEASAKFRMCRSCRSSHQAESFDCSTSPE